MRDSYVTSTCCLRAILVDGMPLNTLKFRVLLIVCPEPTSLQPQGAAPEPQSALADKAETDF